MELSGGIEKKAKGEGRGWGEREREKWRRFKAMRRAQEDTSRIAGSTAGRTAGPAGRMVGRTSKEAEIKRMNWPLV
jgi:hypothetical protein